MELELNGVDALMERYLLSPVPRDASLKMKKLLPIILLLLTACSSEPPITEGKVVNRRFVPAHWEDGYRTESHYGPHCGIDMYGEYDCGIKHYTTQVYEAHHHYVEDYYQLQLQSCIVKDEKEKCRTGWITIPEFEYKKYNIGVNYPSPR